MKNNDNQVVINIEEVLFEEIDVAGCMSSMGAPAE